MELPQARSYGTQGTTETHDFLSLCTPVQQDPRPSQGGFLKTHDFLQPLERVGKNIAKEENEVETIGQFPQPAPPSVEHFLPGGIGTYSISYINQSVSKTDISTFRMAQASSMDRNDENSNGSYSGNSFTLWEESSVKKGKTRKENIEEDRHVVREAGMEIGDQWISSEQQSHSYSKNDHRRNTFSSLASTPSSSAQKNQCFIDMIKYAKGGQEDDDEDGDEFFIKKESSPHPKSDLAVKIDRKSTDQKANTPRSKHSATEQRRRSKINDRFQALRRLIPNSDQKRDKASFLLEVIKYIQFLQEKVQKYEGSCQGWNLEAPKLNPCIDDLFLSLKQTTSKRNAEGFQDQFQGTNSGSGPALMFPVKFENNTEIPSIPKGGQNPADSHISTSTTFKTMDKSPVVSKTGSFPVPLQSSIFHPGRSSSAQLCPRLASDNETKRSQSSSQLWQSRSCTADCTLASDILKERELAVESGTINVSSLYSKGLLNTLTQAMQNSGVDLSQTSISVQIDIGKQANGRLTASTSTIKDDEVPCSNHARFRVASSEEPERALKKLKTGGSSS